MTRKYQVAEVAVSKDCELRVRRGNTFVSPEGTEALRQLDELTKALAAYEVKRMR